MSILAATVVAVGVLLGWGNSAQAQDSTLITKAEEAMVNKEYKEAINLYHKLVKQNPKMSVFKVNLALAYLEMNDACSSIEWFNLALKDEDLSAGDTTVIQMNYLDKTACQYLTVIIKPAKKGVDIMEGGKIIGTTDKDGKAHIAKPFTNVGKVTVIATNDEKSVSTTVDIPTGKGEKVVELTFPTEEKNVIIPDEGKKTTNPPTTNPNEELFTTKHITVTGVGVLSLALLTGGVFANIASIEKSQDLDSLAGLQAGGKLTSSTQAAKLQQELEDMNQMMTLFYVGGGLLAAADVVLYVFWDELFGGTPVRPENTTKPTVTITPNGDGGAVGITIPF